MKKQSFLTATMILMLMSAFAFIQTTNWKVAEDYTVKFYTGTAPGQFTDLKGTIVFDEKNLAASKFEMTIDPATINTGNGMKNTHAKAPEWFDVEKYPVIAFSSTAITKTLIGYEAVGLLDMHGVKNEIKMPFTFKNNTFESAFDVNRKDFNLDDGKHKDMDDMIRVLLTVPVTK